MPQVVREYLALSWWNRWLKEAPEPLEGGTYVEEVGGLWEGEHGEFEPTLPQDRARHFQVHRNVRRSSHMLLLLSVLSVLSVPSSP